MEISIGHKREMVGYRIEVEVKAEGTERIVAVATTYDNFELENEALSPPQIRYKRSFKQVGGYTPGVERTVRVTATNTASHQEIASETWQD